MNLQHVMAWGVFLAIVLAMLAVDLLVLHRKAHEIKMGEAAIGTLLPILLALVFMGGVYWVYSTHFLDLGVVPEEVRGAARNGYPSNGWDAALLFFTGYLVELSLSADNVFLFVVLMGFFKVPRHLQHRVLFWGVMGALVMRGVMVVAGAALLVRFSWIIYVFGAFLIVTGAKMLLSGHEPGDPGKSLAVRMIKKVLPIHAGYGGDRFFTRNDRGVLMGTTLLLVLVCIEVTDLVFALDSIPAIFGITMDPFIVFTSNVFAILGLRSMYFLLAGVMDKFHYLKVGLSLVLGFVGIKMVLPGLGELYAKIQGTAEVPHWEIPSLVSLGVIAGVLAVAVGASLVFPPRHATAGKLA